MTKGPDLTSLKEESRKALFYTERMSSKFVERGSITTS